MFGALLGGRLNPWLSINGELRLDLITYQNAPGVPTGEQRSAVDAEVALSPLFHAQLTTAEMVIGPKVGVFGFSESDSYPLQLGIARKAYGLSYGVNAGIFFPAGRFVSFGGLLSFTIRDSSRQCMTPPGGSQSCTSGSFPVETSVAGHAAALF